MASWFFLILLAPRALNHTFSVSFALWALARLLESPAEPITRTPLFQTGILFGLAFAFRYQEALVLGGAVLLLLSTRRLHFLPPLLLGATLPLLGVGLLDRLTWGDTFHSLFSYLDANLVAGAAGRFGVMPGHFYLAFLPVALGFAIPWLFLLRFANRPALRLFLAITVLGILAHSLTDNKQLRFILPAIVVLFCVLATGADALWEKMGAVRGRVIGATLLGLWMIASIHQAATLSFADLGVFIGLPEAEENPFTFRRDLNRALIKLSRRDDLCGLVIYPYGTSAGEARWATTGGYAYLHQAIPISMGPLSIEAQPFTSHALLCPDHAGRLNPLPDFAPLGKVGTCVVFHRPQFSCDRQAADQFLARARF